MTQARPVKVRTGIGLAARRNVGVARERVDRITPDDEADQRGERIVLRVLEGHAIAAFQFDADGEVIAALAKNDDTPACHARSSQETNCCTSPLRRITKCADTRMPHS